VAGDRRRQQAEGRREVVQAPAGWLVTGVDSKQRADEGPMARNGAGEAEGKQGG